MTPPSLVRGTSIVAVLTTVSRIFGFGRDVLVASVFGASLLTDAFFVAFRLPNLLRSLVAEGALTAAFVPVFSRTLKESQELAAQTFRSMTGVLILLTSGLTAAGVFFAPELIEFFAPGFTESDRLFSLATTLAQIMFPYIIFVSLIALINGALNSAGIFGAAPLAQIVMNCCLAAGALCAIPVLPETGIYFLAWSVIFGGCMQIVVQRSAMRRAGLTLLPGRPLLTAETRQILLLMLPAIFGAAAYQVSVLLNTILASLLSTGVVSWLFYADRVSQLPVGIFTVSLGSVLLPALSRSAANGDPEQFGQELINSLRYTSFVMLPLAGYLFCYADILVAVLFERGSFSALDTQQTALALRGVSVGLWGVGCNYLCLRGFLAHKNTIVPSLLGCFSVILGVYLALVTMGPIRPTGNLTSDFLAAVQNAIASIHPLAEAGHLGLALSSGLASTLVFPLALLLLRSRGLLAVSLSGFLLSTVKILFVTGGLAALALTVRLPIEPPFLSLCVHSVLALVVFLAGALCLQISELQETIDLVKTRLRKRS